MASVEKLSISLTRELTASVREAVLTGDYASESEVIREALRQWKGRREAREASIERLRHAWEEGLASGPELDGDEVLAELQQIVDGRTG
jgi:antitoxin ParD1/3/4